MRQYKLKLPPCRPGSASRLIQTVSGRKLKMAPDTGNATFMVSNKDPVHLFDIDPDGKKHLVAQFTLSPDQKTPPQFIRTGQKYPDPDVPCDEKSKEPEKAAESPAETSVSPPVPAEPVRTLTSQEILQLKVQAIKDKLAKK